MGVGSGRETIKNYSTKKFCHSGECIQTFHICMFEQGSFVEPIMFRDVDKVGSRRKILRSRRKH